MVKVNIKINSISFRKLNKLRTNNYIFLYILYSFYNLCIGYKRKFVENVHISIMYVLYICFINLMNVYAVN